MSLIIRQILARALTAGAGDIVLRFARGLRLIDVSFGATYVGSRLAQASLEGIRALQMRLVMEAQQGWTWGARRSVRVGAGYA